MINAKKHKLIRLWDYLKGEPGQFSLQSRIYHSVCIATILVIAYNIPFSLAVGLYKMSMLSGVLLVMQLYFYYLSRFKNKLNISMILYAIIIHLFFALDFYFSSGIQGATLHSFTIAYFLIIAIAQKRHYWYWTIGHLALVIALIVYEYHHPEIINFRYSGRAHHFTDITSTYIITIGLIFACLTYIINNYNREKKIVEQNALAMKKLNDEKNKLISIISHDFNTPLRNIQTYLSILKKVDLSKEERNELESELSRTTDETQRLLSNLLSWTIKQMDSSEHALSSFQLSGCLEEVLDTTEKAAKAKNIQFITQMNAAIFVKANKELLQTMVRNLLNNAIKFTGEKGLIRISAIEQNKYCLMTIHDTGIGIDADTQKDIFSLNIQSTFGTNHEKGIGLGLVLCKEFADAQHIDIWFESKLGEGTTFYLKIPSE